MQGVQDAVEHFFERLTGSKSRALLLDYDGTLAPFRVEREISLPSPVIVDVLQQIIQKTNTRVVMVTGRSAKSLRALVPLRPVPEIWGTHGLERLLPDGSYQLAPLDQRQLQALQQAHELAVGLNLAPLLEEKPGALALHWRSMTLPATTHARNMVHRAWNPIAQSNGLLLEEFDGGLELRLPVHDKGDAVRTILDEMGPDSVVAYLGDDRTDEDGFRALRIQDLAVLVRTESRDTCADIWIHPPERLAEFLNEWLSACGGAL